MLVAPSGRANGSQLVEWCPLGLEGAVVVCGAQRWGGGFFDLFSCISVAYSFLNAWVFMVPFQSLLIGLVGPHLCFVGFLGMREDP